MYHFIDIIFCIVDEQCWCFLGMFPGQWAQKALYSSRGASQCGLCIWKRSAGHWSTAAVLLQGLSYQTRRGLCICVCGLMSLRHYFLQEIILYNSVYCSFFRGNGSLPSFFLGTTTSFGWFMKLLRISCRFSQSISYTHDLLFYNAKKSTQYFLCDGSVRTFPYLSEKQY